MDPIPQIVGTPLGGNGGGSDHQPHLAPARLGIGSGCGTRRGIRGKRFDEPMVSLIYPSNLKCTKIL